MTRDEAIQEIREIQSGAYSGGSPNRDGVLQLRGKTALKCWDNPVFIFGMKWGAIAALMQAFDISTSEIEYDTCWNEPAST